MGYDIAAFKKAFGYPSAVVGELAKVLAQRIEGGDKSTELRELHEAMEMQLELLTKSEKLKTALEKTKPSFIDLMDRKNLPGEIEELKNDPKLKLAEAKLLLLEELHDLEKKQRTATPMMAGLIANGIKKAKASLGVDGSFTTLTDSDTTSQPKLQDVMLGGGLLKMETPYTGDDGVTYTTMKAISGGGHSAFKLKDDKGREYLWKPAEDDKMREVEVGASTLSERLMPGLVPPCRSLVIDGKKGTCQPFVPGVDDNVKLEELTPKQQEQMVAHMLTDWLVSNHDNHLKQFLFDGDGNLVGIDKGQAFKYFKHGDVESSFVTKAKVNAKNAGENEQLRKRHLADIEPEDLDPNYFPRSNIGLPASAEFMKVMQRSMREFDMNSGVIATTIQNAKSLTLKDIRELFGGYAKEAFAGQEEAFYQAVLERAHNIDKQLEKLQLSAPAAARHHLQQLDTMMTPEGAYKPGMSQAIGKEVEQLSQAIYNLKKVPGILEAQAPQQGQQPDPLYELQQQLLVLEAKQQQLSRINQDCIAGENYLSGDYKRVGTLMAAFEKLGVDPALHNDPSYDYSSIKGKLLVLWKQIAVERKVVPESAVENWDEQSLDDSYEIVRKIARSWDAYPVPTIPGNRVARGDIAANMAANYAELDIEKKDLADGEHAVNISLTWPSLMSTTVGDPARHNFISEKTFVWSFTVKQPCPGRIIGENNPSEQEVTFAPGVKVKINRLIVRRGDKTLEAATYGSNAIVIALAELG